MLTILASMMIFKAMILSPILLMFMTLSYKLLSKITPTPLLVRLLPEYQSLNPKQSISLAFSPTHLVSWMHSMFIFLWIMMSINSINFPMSEPMFQVLILILVSWTSFFAHIHPWCGNPCLFNTAPGRRCSGPCTLVAMFSPYNASLPGDALALTQFLKSFMSLLLDKFYACCRLPNATLHFSHPGLGTWQR